MASEANWLPFQNGAYKPGWVSHQNLHSRPLPNRRQRLRTNPHLPSLCPKTRDRTSPLQSPQMPSLHPKRILVTRSRHQTSALAAQLQALGAEPILVPTIAIAPPETYAPLDAALARLDTFHWLLFTSANAVQAFAERTSALALSSAQHPNRVPHPLAPFAKGWAIAQRATQSFGEPANQYPKIAAIGPATARALTEIGLTPDLLPPQAVAESLAQSLLPHIIPGETCLLLIRAEHARDTLPATLRAAGANLTVTPAYRNLIPHDSIPLLQTLFANPSTWPDAITFTSSSTATNLLTLLDVAGLALPPDHASGAPDKTVLRVSIGPITSQTLRDLGYPPHLEAPEATVVSLVQTLAQQLRLKPL